MNIFVSLNNNNQKVNANIEVCSPGKIKVKCFLIPNYSFNVVLCAVVSLTGDDSSSSDEDLVPLSKLLMRQHSDEKESCDNTNSLTSNANNKSKKDKGDETRV